MNNLKMLSKTHNKPTGAYSPAQRVLYDIVLETQRECMRRLVPGGRLDHVHRFMVRSLAAKLRDAGVFLPHVNCHTDDQLALIGQLCCPHHVSHYLGRDFYVLLRSLMHSYCIEQFYNCLVTSGMDVHDSSTMSRGRPLEPSMVVTNEPGVYFPSYLKVRSYGLISMNFTY